MVLLPVVLGAVYVIVETTRRERDLAYQQVQRWARVIADHHVQLTAHTRLTLETLARTESVRSADSFECERMLGHILDSFPQYANLGVIEKNGRLSCSAVPSPPLNLSDRRYFRDALATGRFAGGDYQIGRITKRSSINYAIPVFDDGQRVTRVVFAAVDLNWLNEWPGRMSVPDGTTVLLVDSADVILFRYPDSGRWRGQRLTNAAMLEVLRNPGTRSTEARGLDGVRRLYAYATAHPQGTAALRLLVGIPESEALALAHRLRQGSAIFLLLFVFAGVAAAWVLARTYIVDRIAALDSATARLTRGDLTARTGITSGNDELSRLAKSFDVMAASLEENNAALQRVERNNRFLAEASAILGSSLDYERTLRSVAELSVEWLADWCAIDLRETGNGSRLFTFVHHADPAKRRVAAELQSRHPSDLSDDSHLGNQVIRTGRSMLIRHVGDDVLVSNARSQDHLNLLRSLGLRSVIIVPLRAATECIGTLTLVTAEEDRAFDDTDLRIAEELGRRAALAVENARLYSEMEARVRDRTAELTAVNRELETFSYSVSHDLRSPLRSLAGFSQALEEDYEQALDAAGKDYLRRIRAAAQRMGQLIDDLLTLSRITRMDLVRTTVDVSGIAEGVVRELQNVPEREVDVTIQPHMQAAADPGLLRIVLENLIGNAWKFTGRVSNPRIEIGSHEENGELVFFVRDNGAGFDMAYADKLFGAFQRLHAMTDFSGTGIGLATVQRIITRHGGRIWAEAEPGHGATFFFTLASR